MFAGILLLAVFALRAVAVPFDQSHSLYDRVLKTYVKNALVDYAGLKAHPQNLDRYLQELASVDEAQFKTWTVNQQLAFLINAYNASTLKLVADHYPIASIKDIGGLFGSPFRQDAVRLFGRTMTLDDLEHGIIRPRYHDPRVHFALVCGARSCPQLRSEAYVGSRLDEQLRSQGRWFMLWRNQFDLENKSASLSSIFHWFSEDFGGNQSALLHFIAPYTEEGVRQSLESDPESWNITYVKYDWALNVQSVQ